MTRGVSMAALVLLLATPLAAQVPEGWQMRVDRSTNASDPDNVPDVKFVTMGQGFHVTTGPAVVLWNPANTTTGMYTVKGRFRLTKPSSHNNYYGLVFGGGDLAGAGQNYLYFLVGQNGTFIVNHRAGDQVHQVQARTPHASIARPDSASGSSVNTLEVRVGTEQIDYVVNGQVVHTTPKAGMTARTDGIWGVRVNHVLDVHVDQLGITK